MDSAHNLGTGADSNGMNMKRVIRRGGGIPLALNKRVLGKDCTSVAILAQVSWRPASKLVPTNNLFAAILLGYRQVVWKLRGGPSKPEAMRIIEVGGNALRGALRPCPLVARCGGDTPNPTPSPTPSPTPPTPSPTPSPTPTPAPNKVRMACNGAGCSQNCQYNEFYLGTCIEYDTLDKSFKVSACTTDGVQAQMWDNSWGCEDVYNHTTISRPLGVCVVEKSSKNIGEFDSITWGCFYRSDAVSEDGNGTKTKDGKDGAKEPIAV